MINVLIPMAGAGTRFKQKGYELPKPLIDVNGKPMIQRVVESLNINGNYIFIIQKDHEVYNIKEILNSITPNNTLIELDHVTEGAACSTLLAKEFINNNDELLIVNSDQYIVWNSEKFLEKVSQFDAGILTFKDTNTKWSFVKLDENQNVVRVAEKNPISDIATVGVYYWKKGSDYVSYAEQMIQKNIRVNNEFYVCPVFNEAILDNKKITTYPVSEMWGLGTPEDLENFIKYETHCS